MLSWNGSPNLHSRNPSSLYRPLRPWPSTTLFGAADGLWASESRLKTRGMPLILSSRWAPIRRVIFGRPLQPSTFKSGTVREAARRTSKAVGCRQAHARARRLRVETPPKRQSMRGDKLRLRRRHQRRTPTTRSCRRGRRRGRREKAASRRSGGNPDRMGIPDHRLETTRTSVSRIVEGPSIEAAVSSGRRKRPPQEAASRGRLKAPLSRGLCRGAFARGRRHESPF
jgi:hypothetical protein